MKKMMTWALALLAAFSVQAQQVEPELADPKPGAQETWNAVKKTTLAWGSTDVRYSRSQPATGAKALVLDAWRGERVSAQAVLSTPVDLSRVTMEVSDLKCGKSIIPAASVRKYFVRYVMTDWHNNKADSFLLPDHLSPDAEMKVAAHTTRPMWLDIRVPQDAKPGTYKGMQLAATSTGIGGPSSEICIHELNTLGGHTCIRVGTTGCIVPQFDLGDLIIPVACYRKDGTSATYIEPEFPSFANPYVNMALIQACENLGFRYGIGLDYTVGSFYIGQGRPLYEDGRKSYWPSFAEKILPDLATAGVTNIEMETAGQLVVGYLHGMRMGCILSVISNRVLDRWGDNGGEEKTCLAAAEAMRILKEWDDSGTVTLKAKMKR